MKSLMSVIVALLGSRTTRTNLAALTKLLVVLVVIITTYSLIFHLLMESEGQHHSWITGFYWTLTVMSTLGFGDITFHSDPGRLFSIIVLITGVVFLLVLLPFTFIEFFYAPWMEAQQTAKAARTLPPSTKRHVIFTNYGPVARLLIRMLEEYGYGYYFLVPDVKEALQLRDQGVPVVVGDRSDPETYRSIRIEQAAMVVTTLDDVTNTNVTFTVRELSESVPIVASATSDTVRDALELAGVTHILRLEEMMGDTLARRVLGNDATAHVIGEIDDLVIAEANPGRTPLIGRTVAESGLRAETGVTVVGAWVKGQFQPVDPETEIAHHTVLVLAGTQEQIDRYNHTFGQAQEHTDKVVIAGGGRVGRATARALTEAGVPWTLIEKLPERVRGMDNTIIGDASDFDVLVKSGMHEAATVIITTHDDDINTFLTIFYRRLRHSLQIICRCTQATNVSRLHRAGANLVLSYASMGAFAIFNVLRGSDTVLLAEGVNIFTVDVPPSLAGKSIAASAVRSRTGCSIIALAQGDVKKINPDPSDILPEDGELVLVGALEDEKKFINTFKPTV